MRVQVRVQKKYFFEFKFEFGKMIEFLRVQVRVRSPGLNYVAYVLKQTAKVGIGLGLEVGLRCSLGIINFLKTSFFR